MSNTLRHNFKMMLCGTILAVTLTGCYGSDSRNDFKMTPSQPQVVTTKQLGGSLGPEVLKEGLELSDTIDFGELSQVIIESSGDIVDGYNYNNGDTNVYIRLEHDLDSLLSNAITSTTRGYVGCDGLIVNMDDFVGLDYMINAFPALTKSNIEDVFSEIDHFEKTSVKVESTDSIKDRHYDFALKVDDGIFLVFDVLIHDGQYRMSYSILDMDLNLLANMPPIVEDYLIPNHYTPSVKDGDIVAFNHTFANVNVGVKIDTKINSTNVIFHNDIDITADNILDVVSDHYGVFFNMFHIDTLDEQKEIVAVIEDHLDGLTNDMYGSFENKVDVSGLKFDLISTLADQPVLDTTDTTNNHSEYIISFKNITKSE